MSQVLRARSEPLMVDPRGLRSSDPSWDFRGADTRYASHGIYRYPAMMVAPVVRRLIDEFSPDIAGPRLLDPFCGSGSVLVEGMLHGINPTGVDINPLAVLLARVKTTPLTDSEVGRELKSILRRASGPQSALPSVSIPNLGFWYSPRAIRDLARLRASIMKARDPKIRRFFECAFAETARYVSWTRKDEFKIYRMPESSREDWSPDALETFASVVDRNRASLADFSSRLPDDAPTARVIEGDARDPRALPDEEYDLIVTSPPYGDSRTTVAYGQYSSLSLSWLGYDRVVVNRTDRESLGGRPVNLDTQVPTSDTLTVQLTQVRRADPGRARDVLSFYVDLLQAFKRIAKMLSPAGRACIVVGNRTVKGVRLETDVILSEILQRDCHLTHLETIVRGIPNKQMPLRNSPTNVPGRVGDTMANEFVLVFEKPRLS